MEEKKIFIRIGAAVSMFKGGAIGTDVNDKVTEAWLLPILTEKSSAKLPSNDAEKNSSTVLINLRKSVDQYLNHVYPEVAIGWNDIQIEGAGITSDGDRASAHTGREDQILLNSFGSEWPAGKNLGLLSLEYSFFTDTVKKMLPPKASWVYDGLEPYQVLSILYQAKEFPKGREGKRYIGFKGKLLEWGKDGRARIVISSTFWSGKEKEAWFDVNDINVCDFAVKLGPIFNQNINLLHSKSIANDEGGFFVEVQHAADLELFIDPKTPFQAGEALTSLLSGASLSSPDLNKINILHREADKEPTLDVIAERIDGEGRILEPLRAVESQTSKNQGLTAVVKELVSNGPSMRRSPRTLDLIGHARHGFLYIGKWKVDFLEPSTRAAFEELVPVLLEGDIHRIRLVGCSTGKLSARDSLSALQSFLRKELNNNKFRVYGAGRPIYASDFSNEGLTALASVDMLPANSTKPDVPLAEHLARLWSEQTDSLLLREREDFAQGLLQGAGVILNRETIEQILRPMELYGDLYPIVIPEDKSINILDLVEGVPARIEGLLELPYAELVYPIGVVPGFHRMTVLFDGSFVRLYPVGSSTGWVYSVKRDFHSHLRDLVAGGTPLSSLPATQRKP